MFTLQFSDLIRPVTEYLSVTVALFARVRNCVCPQRRFSTQKTDRARGIRAAFYIPVTRVSFWAVIAQNNNPSASEASSKSNFACTSANSAQAKYFRNTFAISFLPRVHSAVLANPRG